jgi:iron complex outermembrane receptor protein
MLGGRAAARLSTGTSGSALAAALLIAGLAMPAHAQEAAEPAQESEEIVVTGFRAALESAVSTKKDSDQIVESVSAEDIGKLPDASIAESIARLPGLTSQRISGRSSFISIRGFGPDFSATLLNGRPQTSTNDNRGIEFDQYPSEVVNAVNVYKTPNASLTTQGLVGTVDIRTIRPLDYGKEVLAVGARGIYTDMGKLNSGSKDWGYRLNATYVGKFLDDRLGIALSAAYVDEPYQIEEFEAWGYATNPAGVNLIGGVKPFVTTSQLQRLGISGTIQADLGSNWELAIDGFYSNFDDTQIKRGIELPLAWSGATLSPTGVEITDNLVTAGTFSGVEGVVNNHNYLRQADLYSGGVNLKHEGDDGWNVNFDFGWSRTDRRELILESNAGTGPGGGVGATDTLSFRTTETGTFFTSRQLNYSDPSLIVLTDPLGWGGGAPGGRQHGYYNDRIVDDELFSYLAEIEKEFENGPIKSIKLGANYVDRAKSLVPDEYFLQLAGGALQAQVPSQYRLTPTNLAYLGLGPVLSYNPLDLLNGGVYTRVANTAQDVLFKSFNVEEEVLSSFAMLNLGAEWDGARLTGSVGVLAQHTNQNSTGYIQTPTGPQLRTLGDDYWDVLPSLSLSLRFDSDFVIRFGAAREIQRPRLDDMRVNIAYGANIAEGIVTGSGGNPSLRPYRATAFDLTFEKYWGRSGYVALQLFHKTLHNYIYTAERPFDYSSYPLIQPTPPVDTMGRISQPFNGDGGKIYGAELAGTIPFETFTSALTGFGVTGGVSYTKSELRPDPSQPPENIPGYSDWVANGTAYFEKWGFNLRGSVRYRSTFLGDFSGLGAVRQRRRALDETIVDAQIGYDFQPGSALEGLSLFVQGSNLTDEPFVATNPGRPLEVMNYQRFGRRFQAGFTFKF